MLKAKKIRLDVSAQDAATLEFMRGASAAASTTGSSCGCVPGNAGASPKSRHASRHAEPMTRS
jgi:hypothetical protein